MSVLFSTYLVWFGFFSVFPLACFSCPLARSTCAFTSGGQLTLESQDHETWRVTRPRDSCGPVYSRQNELRSRWEKFGVFCRSNCTRYDPTSLTAVAAWTPACVVRSARRWLVLRSTAAVLVPSRIRCNALGSLSGTVRHACPFVTFRALLAFVSFSSGLPLDITTNYNN